MDASTPEELAKFAADVREQHDKFVDAATEVFRQLVTVEYPRLRSCAWEAGAESAELRVVVRCNFDPKSRRVEMESEPVARPRPRLRAASVG